VSITIDEWCVEGEAGEGARRLSQVSLNLSLVLEDGISKPLFLTNKKLEYKMCIV